MRIKTLSLVGFKSYGLPTTLPLFHRDCAVIAGLNGSGKSNLLDAIIFALGSTNANPRQLVYNEGRAGITKASISILFDNTEPTWRPLGYEHLSEIAMTRQITLDGKDEYLINGDRVPPSMAHNLFRSVLLDVSRPYFLVRQGRVAMVQNMKPYEILSMLVEAADIPMDDIEAVAKALEMKQIQIDEINELLHRHTLPALEKLWKEYVQYTQWELGKAELERSYVRAEEIRKNVAKMRVESQELERKISDLTAQKDASMGKDVKEMSDKVKELLREEYMLEKEKSLDDRLFDAKMAVLNVRCEINKLAVLTDHYEKELKEKRNELSLMQEEAVAAENQLNSKRREVENVRKALEFVPYKEEDMEAVGKTQFPIDIFETYSKRIRSMRKTCPRTINLYH